MGSSLHDKDNKLATAPKDAYCIPLSKDFRSVDSLIWPNKMLQITVNKTHDMDHKFLKTQMGILREQAGPKVPIILYFVTPSDVYQHFEVDPSLIVHTNRKNEEVGIFDEVCTVGIDMKDSNILKAMFDGRSPWLVHYTFLFYYG
jgi:hypothetical protein